MQRPVGIWRKRCSDDAFERVLSNHVCLFRSCNEKKKTAGLCRLIKYRSRRISLNGKAPASTKLWYSA